MRTIWKYPIPRTPSFALVMPRDATILTVQLQDGKPVLWALVEVEEPDVAGEDRHFKLLMTGQEMEPAHALAFDAERLRYVNTFQGNAWGPTLVFHLFEYRSGS